MLSLRTILISIISLLLFLSFGCAQKYAVLVSANKVTADDVAYDSVWWYDTVLMYKMLKKMVLRKKISLSSMEKALILIRATIPIILISNLVTPLLIIQIIRRIFRISSPGWPPAILPKISKK